MVGPQVASAGVHDFAPAEEYDPTDADTDPDSSVAVTTYVTASAVIPLDAVSVTVPAVPAVIVEDEDMLIVGRYAVKLLEDVVDIAVPFA